MKSKIPTAAALLLALTLPLFGCAEQPGTQTPESNTEPSIDTTQYINAIESLEGELKEQKQSFYLKENAYKIEIAELQQQITTLVAQIEKGGTTELVYRYRLENNEAIITGYSGNATLLSIPQTLDGYPVVAIGERAFENSGVAAVVLPEGIKKIEWFAFYGCEELVNVTLPASVSSIGYAVFDGCSELRIFCPKSSYAEKYAQSYGISCVAS